MQLRSASWEHIRYTTHLMYIPTPGTSHPNLTWIWQFLHHIKWLGEQFRNELSEFTNFIFCGIAPSHLICIPSNGNLSGLLTVNPHLLKFDTFLNWPLVQFRNKLHTHLIIFKFKPNIFIKGMKSYWGGNKIVTYWVINEKQSGSHPRALEGGGWSFQNAWGGIFSGWNRCIMDLLKFLIFGWLLCREC